MTNKLLLALIAAGLWANAFASMTKPAKADVEANSYLSEIANDIHHIKSDINGLAYGICTNLKLC